MAEATDATVSDKLVCFYVGDQEFAVPITQVRESLAMRPVTRVFLTPPWLAGVINVRGDIVSLIDTSVLLGHGPSVVGANSRIVVVKCEEGIAGLLVDSLSELRTIDRADIRPVPATASPQRAALLQGIAVVESGAVRIIDAAAVFASDSLRLFRRDQ